MLIAQEAHCARARERMETSPVWTLASIHAGRFLFFFLLNDQRERGLPSLFVLPNADMRPVHVTICDNNKTTISCKNGRNQLARHPGAICGRLDRKTCRDSPAIHSINFRAAKSLSVVQSASQGKAICVLHAKNSVFGDPCSGTDKHLFVKYKCLE